MNSSIFKTAIFGVLLLLGGQVQALSINDPGVVGTIWHCEGSTPCSNSNPTTETAMAQHLLDMAINSTDTTDANGDGYTEDYTTGGNDYSGTLSLGIQGPSDSNTGFGIYEYVLAKYDGPNAGYVLFNVADYGTTLPMYPSPLWTENPEQYAISHWTGFNASSVPAPGAALLLGLGLIGLVGMRKKIS